MKIFKSIVRVMVVSSGAFFAMLVACQVAPKAYRICVADPSAVFTAVGVVSVFCIGGCSLRMVVIWAFKKD